MGVIWTPCSCTSSSARNISPGKSRVTVEDYFAAFRRAVEVFGEGQVSSYVIVGLGESTESILAGCQRLVDMGVYPFVVPLRPIVGSAMEDVSAPSAEEMIPIYQAVADMLHRRGMHFTDSLAGCVRCGACSALPAFTVASGNGREPAAAPSRGAATDAGAPGAGRAPGHG